MLTLRGKNYRWLLGAVVVLAAIFLGLSVKYDFDFDRLDPRTFGQASLDHVDRHSTKSTDSISENIEAESSGALNSAINVSLLAELNSLLGDLKANRDTGEPLLTRLARIKSLVHTLPPDVAAATIIACLESGEDAPTGLLFAVGFEGVLKEAPTYRTILLDLLGQTEPGSSIDYSRKIVSSPGSPEEMALALRNLGWLNSDGSQTAFLQEAFTRMLDNPNWADSPSGGFLESYDIAVAFPSVHIVRRLAGRQTNETNRDQLNRATFIALDRIMVRTPSVILDTLSQDPSFLADKPTWRSSLLARLDPAIPAHVDQMRNYLLNTKHGDGELENFSNLYPLANYFEGNRLVTDWETSRPTQTIKERDMAALALINKMIEDPSFKTVETHLQTIIKRMQDYGY